MTQTFSIMKKKFFATVAVAIVVAAVSVFVSVNNGKSGKDDLFNANVEALADDEGGGNDYAANIWFRYDRPDGFNCTKGGTSNCL